ncbi:HAD family hydrolase [Anaeroselena agilis]|uniref:Haloacid dehalogenase-like hydrolase n=1 Tax=Anaeroselena agilis TaxID=3063788 RepID=A0ABU3P0D8_9FIRM|nr:haloacid dehalogenase-like hydrolase [Selenomonadales bacterium 4137-cl]
MLITFKELKTLKILFWDIDGTLLRTAKAGLFAFRQATEELYAASPDYDRVTTAGMTDCHIAAQIIALATGREPRPEETAALVKRYIELLPAHLEARRGYVIPPVADILAHVDGEPGYVSLLLTGNTAAGAHAKLTSYGIAQYFDFAVSAFGDDCASRTEISSRALASVKERYPAVPPEDIFVIGDTPNDISCGKAIGARTVAVATGTFTAAELAAHSPWWAVEQLPAPAEFAAKLAGK